MKRQIYDNFSKFANCCNSTTVQQQIIAALLDVDSDIASSWMNKAITFGLPFSLAMWLILNLQDSALFLSQLVHTNRLSEPESKWTYYKWLNSGF